MALVVGAETKGRWVPSELAQFESDGLEYYLREINQPVVRLVEQKAKENPVARRHKLFDPDRQKATVVDGNEVQAFGFELADYALLNTRHTRKGNVPVFLPNGEFDESREEDDERNPRYLPAELSDTVTLTEGTESFEVTVKELMLANVDVQNEIIRLGRRIANTSEEAARKNVRR